MLSPTEWAYLAGLIDGEGSISISHTVIVRIPNTDMAIIGWLTDHFPDAKVVKANSNTSYGKKLCLNVRWNGRNSAEVLTQTLPYLQSKKRKLAELALEFLQYVDDAHCLTASKFEAREAIREVATILNSSKS